jgi:hypothetical protein
MGTVYILVNDARFMWPFIDLVSSPVTASIFAHTFTDLQDTFLPFV